MIEDCKQPHIFPDIVYMRLAETVQVDQEIIRSNLPDHPQLGRYKYTLFRVSSLSVSFHNHFKWVTSLNQSTTNTLDSKSISYQIYNQVNPPHTVCTFTFCAYIVTQHHHLSKHKNLFRWNPRVILFDNANSIV